MFTEARWLYKNSRSNILEATQLKQLSVKQFAFNQHKKYSFEIFYSLSALKYFNLISIIINSS